MVSVLLGTETEGFDFGITAFRDAHRYDLAGVDAVVDAGDQTQIRDGFSVFSGQPPERNSFQVPIGDRRRFIIIDGYANFEIKLITNDYRSSRAEEVRAIIDAIEPVAIENPLIDYFGGEPQVMIQLVSDKIHISFERKTNVEGLDCHFEFSSDLVTWEELVMDEDQERVESLGNERETVTRTMSRGESNGFLRFRVSGR